MSPTVRTNATLGWGRERPETERWRHTRRSAQVGVTVALPWGFTVGGSGTLRWADYEGSWFPFVAPGEFRRDRTRSLRVNVYHRGFTLGGFSPQISVVRETRTTNAQAHGYERTFGELRFVRQF